MGRNKNNNAFNASFGRTTNNKEGRRIKVFNLNAMLTDEVNENAERALS